MQKIVRNVLLSLAALIAVPALAANDGSKGTRDEAVAMVERGVALYEAEGLEALTAAVMDPTDVRFHDRDLYVFVLNDEGVNFANGASPALVGKDMMGIKDLEGKAFIADMVHVVASDGEGWVEYKWPNPQTKAIETKAAFVKSLSSTYWLGVGVYAN